MPFPFDLVKIELQKYKNAKICWAQEEHKNGGAYEFVKLRIESLLRASEDSRLNELK